MTHKPMKPVKAWALVHSDGSVGRSTKDRRPRMYETRKIAEKALSDASAPIKHERIARVEIREVVK